LSPLSPLTSALSSALLSASVPRPLSYPLCVNAHGISAVDLAVHGGAGLTRLLQVGVGDSPPLRPALALHAVWCTTGWCSAAWGASEIVLRPSKESTSRLVLILSALCFAFFPCACACL
jgi:hypothetical protein